MALDLSALTPQEQISALFVGYFDRAPAPSGLNYWVGELTSGNLTLAQIAASFAAQLETVGLYPALGAPNLATPATNLALIEDVFQNLFGRAPTGGADNFWVQELNDGADIGQVIIDIISGAQGDDLATVENKIEVGLAWSTQALTNNVATSGNPLSEVVNGQLIILDQDAYDSARTVLDGVDETDASVTAANAAIDTFFAGTTATPGDVSVLTDDIGEVVVGTGGDDTFRAVLDGAVPANGTLNIGDSIDGVGGTDTFNLLVATAGGLPAGVTVEDVEVVNLLQAAAALTAVDSADFDGVQQLWQVDATSGAAVSVGAGVAAGFRDVTVAAADAVTAKNGVESLTAALDSVNNASNVTFAETTANDVTSVTVAGSVDAAAGVNTLTIDSSGLGAVETATVSISSDTNVTYTPNTTETLLDFSGSTGDLTLTATNAGFTGETLDLLVGTGNNNITFNVANDLADIAVDLQLNTGDDVVTVAAVAAVGNLTAAANQGDLEADLITISNFSTADDALDISAITGLSSRTAQNIVDAAVAGETTLFDAATAALATTGGTADDFVLFDFEGDTYIGIDADGGQALNAGDGLIQITGVSVSDLDATNFVS